MALQVVACMNPDAVEIHRGSRSVATIRRNQHGEWYLCHPSGDGATHVPADVLTLAADWIRESSQRTDGARIGRAPSK